MFSFETFLLGLLVVSTLTSLVTEAIKKILTEHNKTYYSNTLVGVIALILSTAIGGCYILLSGAGFTPHMIIYWVALVFMSWLCAMIGYDKVIQAISQFKTSKRKD